MMLGSPKMVCTNRVEVDWKGSMKGTSQIFEVGSTRRLGETEPNIGNFCEQRILKVWMHYRLCQFTYLNLQICTQISQA